MKLKDLLEEVPYILEKGTLEQEIEGVEYDSRKVGAGSLFVAVKGYETDGHLYIGKAIDKGATVIVCEVMPEVVAENITYIKIEDSRESLARISANFFGRPGEEIKVIGITGTNGKTSITYLLKEIFKEAGHKVGIIGTIHNEIADEVFTSDVTTPESRDIQALLRDMVTAGCGYCFMEVSSHALYLKRAFGIPFKAGIFTNLTQDHLDFHETLEAYQAAKEILFESLAEDGFSVINIDDEAGEAMIRASGNREVITYAVEDKGDFTPHQIVMDLFGTHYQVMYEGQELEVEIGLIGYFNIYNSLGAIATALALGIDTDAVLRGAKKARVPGRFEVISEGAPFVVVVDYAHTPDGLLNVLKTGKDLTEGRVISVFGCGGDRDRTKRPIMGEIGGQESDYAILTSDNPRTEDPDGIIDEVETGIKKTATPYEKIENRKEAIRRAIEIAEKNDIIIIAGKGHEDYQILGKTKHPFSDKEIGKGFLNDRYIKRN